MPGQHDCTTVLDWSHEKFERKDYIAIVTGPHPKFGWNRRFLYGSKMRGEFQLRQGWAEHCASVGSFPKLVASSGLPFVTGLVLEVHNRASGGPRRYYQITVDSGDAIEVKRLNGRAEVSEAVSVYEMPATPAEEPLPTAIIEPYKPEHVKKAEARLQVGEWSSSELGVSRRSWLVGSFTTSVAAEVRFHGPGGNWSWTTSMGAKGASGRAASCIEAQDEADRWLGSCDVRLALPSRVQSAGHRSAPVRVEAKPEAAPEPTTLNELRRRYAAN